MTFPPTEAVFDIRLHVEHDDMPDVLDAIENLGSEIGFGVELLGE